MIAGVSVVGDAWVPDALSLPFDATYRALLGGWLVDGEALADGGCAAGWGG